MPNIDTLSMPRQLVLGGFCGVQQTTRTTDDAVLQAAISRLLELPGFTMLTRAFQEVLIALMARRDFRAPTNIHPSAYNQAFIAQAAGVSRSTVKRAYSMLCELGWLVRGEQHYNERKKLYEGTPIEFSHTFAEAAGLSRSFESAAKEIVPRAPESIFKVEVPSGALAETHKEIQGAGGAEPRLEAPPVGQNEPHIKEDSLKQSLQRQSPRPAGKQSQVPRELYFLTEKGIKREQVFWLMGLATKAGKRLSDIVEVKLEAIIKRSGRLLIGFLQHLIRQNVDYAWRKKEIHEVAQEQAVIHRSECELDGLEDSVVCIGNSNQPVRIKRMSSGFVGELQSGGGSIPHGELIKLSRAGKVKPWSKSTEECKTDSRTAVPSQRNTDISEDAMNRIRALVGIRSAS